MENRTSCNPGPLTLSGDIQAALQVLADSRTAPHAQVQRAQIVLKSAAGLSARQIGKALGCTDRTVRTWRSRFRADPRLGSLEDLRRSGRPSKVAVSTRCRLVQLACERPDETVTAFRDVWTYAALSDALFAATGVRISVSEVGRVLRFDKLRPHRVKQWLHSPDPAFAEKAERICNLYLDGLSSGVVVCVDEKPLIIRSRKHPIHPAPDGRVRLEYEYERHGTASLIGAFDVTTGQVFGSVEPNRKADTLVAFMENLAQKYPTGNVTIVWDNLNIHHDGPSERWIQFNQRHGGRFNFVYTPIHASWLNQIEIWFGILERRVLRHGDFSSFEAIRSRIHGFIQHWNHVEGHPFRWTWRTDKLETQCRKAA